MAFIEANGEMLHCAQAGNGPAVLCLHGLGSSGAMWRALEDHLGDRYTVHSLDCRGHGQSSCNGALTVPNMADDLAAVATALGLDGFHLIGVSAGAQASMMVAATTPGRVRSLLVLGAVLKAGDNLADEVYGIREAVHYLNEEDFALQTAEALLSTDAGDDWVSGLAADMRTLGRRRYLEGLESFAASDNTALARAIAAPTLILRGEFDDLITPEDSDALAGAVAGARQEIVAGGGHFACFDNPDSVSAFNRAVAEFLAGHC